MHFHEVPAMVKYRGGLTKSNIEGAYTQHPDRAESLYLYLMNLPGYFCCYAVKEALPWRAIYVWFLINMRFLESERKLHNLYRNSKG